MKRWAIIIPLICTILGVATTVAVAWVCALCSSWRGLDVYVTIPDDVLVGEFELNTWIAREGLGIRLDLITPPRSSMPTGARRAREPSVAELTGREVRTIRRFEAMARRHRAFMLNRWSAGWPAAALECWGFVAHGDLFNRVDIGDASPPAWVDALRARLGPIDPTRRIPLTPLWPGFLANTTIYGAAWFAVIPWFGPRLARRAWRKRKGRCPMCAYDLRGELAAGCSECGWNKPKGVTA